MRYNMLIKIKYELIDELKMAYKEHFKDKNWGSWNFDFMPKLPVGYSINQYDNTNGEKPPYDIIKFDEVVIIENEYGNRKGRRFILSGQRQTNVSPVRTDGCI